MRAAVFSTEEYECTIPNGLNAGHRHELVYFDTLLGPVPMLRKHKQTKEFVADAVNDNKQMRKLLAKLDQTPRDREEFTTKSLESVLTPCRTPVLEWVPYMEARASQGSGTARAALRERPDGWGVGAG